MCVTVHYHNIMVKKFEKQSGLNHRVGRKNYTSEVVNNTIIDNKERKNGSTNYEM